jgi:hypothetical protein
VVHPANRAASAGFKPAFIPRLIFASGSSPRPLFVELGVGHPDNCAATSNVSVLILPFLIRPP